MRQHWFALLTGMLAITSASAEQTPTAADAEPVLREWTVPWEKTRPRDPSLAPDGSVWFVGQLDNYLARFDPESETFERHELPDGTRPHTVVVAGDGTPWVAGNGNGTIVRYDHDSNGFTVYEVPEAEGVERRDPHTFAFDGRGGLWFTMQRGNAIGHMNLADGSMRIVALPTAGALPYGIVSTRSGRPWAVLLGSNKLVTIDPNSFELREIELPREQTRSRRIGLDSRGRVWYADFIGGHIGVHDPADGSIQEWPAPSERSGPYAMAIDHRDRIWFVETFPQPNRLVAFAGDSQRYVHGLDVDAQTIRHMVFDAGSQTIWFGTDNNTLGRLRLP